MHKLKSECVMLLSSFSFFGIKSNERKWSRLVKFVHSFSPWLFFHFANIFLDPFVVLDLAFLLYRPWISSLFRLFRCYRSKTGEFCIGLLLLCQFCWWSYYSSAHGYSWWKIDPSCLFFTVFMMKSKINLRFVYRSFRDDNAI